MNLFSYTTLEVNEAERSIENTLNHWGAQGWEVIHVSERPPVGGAHRYVFILKKPIDGV